jgi:hypothetical protein
MGIYIRLVSPFGLPEPDPAWLQPIADYDADLRIYPSQKDYVYRLARLATNTGGMNGKMFGALDNLHPDTKICLNHHLVPVTTIPVAATFAPPDVIVEQLRRRDTFGMTAEQIDALMQAQVDDREARIDRENREAVRDRVKAMRIGLLSRTGSRISLVSPRRPGAHISTETPLVASTAGSVSRP